jgi:hypothetical protein
MYKKDSASRPRFVTWLLSLSLAFMQVMMMFRGEKSMDTYAHAMKERNQVVARLNSIIYVLREPKHGMAACRVKSHFCGEDLWYMEMCEASYRNPTRTKSFWHMV